MSGLKPQPQHHLKKRQLKWLVIASFLIVLILWFYWLGSGGLTRGSKNEKVELFSNISDTTQKASTGFWQVKEQVSQSIEKLRSAGELISQQQEVVSKMKEKIGTVTSTTSTASTSATTTVNVDGEEEDN